jgi:hypothetical protein
VPVAIKRNQKLVELQTLQEALPHAFIKEMLYSRLYGSIDMSSYS